MKKLLLITALGLFLGGCVVYPYGGYYSNNYPYPYYGYPYGYVGPSLGVVHFHGFRGGGFHHGWHGGWRH